jgi:hypothetical protein
MSRRALPSLLRPALVALVSLLVAACATVPPSERVARPEAAAVPGFVFTPDTFAFANLIAARHARGDDVYAHYCFVLARGLRQFFAFARFDPASARLSPEAYVERVRAVTSRSPWAPPLSPDARVVIPGYANLREFSEAQESALKEGLGSSFWTLVHWTNWRVTFPVTAGGQEEVAEEIMSELAAGRLVQLLVTNLPKIELNHTVVAFEYRVASAGVEFGVWDPNEPEAPGVITFDRSQRRFYATRMFDTEPGPIRAFRMYYAWYL